MFTALFIGFLAVSAIIIGLGVASDAGATVPGYKHPAPAPTPVAPPVVIPELSNDKANLTPNGETIVGLRSPVLIKSPSTLTTATFDTTTYGDRAIVKLTNSTGSSLSMTGLAIRGKIVSQLAGKNGYVWEYSDYDAIEKEGEKFVEVSNDFIFTPSQAKNIGDFVWKELKPHKLYSLMLVGMHYNYEIGDVYHLTLTHVMNGGTMEDIDTDVEVMGTSMSRSVGGVGTTNLNLRVPSSAWALTLARNARLVGAGNSQRLNNRSNVVTVASSTWTGQADYFCDGTDDNVEIQAAIDHISVIGGGTVELTSGEFNIEATLNVKSNVSINGSITGTTINKNTFNGDTISIVNSTNITISNILIENKDATNNKDTIYIHTSTYIDIRNIYISGGRYSGIYLYDSISITISGSAFYNIGWPENSYGIETRNNTSELTISSCVFDYCDGSGIRIDSTNTSITGCTISNDGLNGIYATKQCSIQGCISHNNSAYGIFAQGSNIVISGCITHSNTQYGIHVGASGLNCVVVGNRSYSNGSTNYQDSGTSTISSGNSTV